MGDCAGIDWASEEHDVLIEDPAGEELLVATFAHDEDGVSALCGALACFDVEVVAIERPDGVLVIGCWRRRWLRPGSGNQPSRVAFRAYQPAAERAFWIRWVGR